MMIHVHEVMHCRFSLVMLIIGIHIGLFGCAQSLPVSHNPHVLQGIKLGEQQKWPEAIAEYTQAIQQDPQDSVAYSRRGMAYHRRGELEESLGDYNRAIELDGGRVPENIAGRGISRLDLGMTEAALDDFSHAIAMGYNTADVYGVRGRAYSVKGLKAEAVADLTRSIERDATKPWTYGRRGMMLVGLEQYRQGLEDLERFVPTAPTNSRALAKQGFALFKLGQRERAKEIVQRLIEMESRLATNFSDERWTDFYDWDKRRAMVRQALATASQAEQSGDIAAAFREYERARSWSTGYPSRGWGGWGHGMRIPENWATDEERKEGESIWKGLIRLYPKLSVKPVPPEEVRRYFVQAETMVKDQSYVKALEAYGDALSVAPWWPPAWFNRAFLLIELGYPRFAVREMKIYLDLDPNAADARAAQDKIYEWEAKGK